MSWKEHISCLLLFLLDLSNWEMYLFLFRAFFFFFRTLKILFLVIESLFDFHICVYEQSISHLLLYFSISSKVFIFCIMSQKSLNLLLWFRTRWQDKRIGSFLPMIMDSEWNCSCWEIKKKRSCLCGICNTVEREFPAPVSPQQPRC